MVNVKNLLSFFFINLMSSIVNMFNNSQNRSARTFASLLAGVCTDAFTMSSIILTTLSVWGVSLNLGREYDRAEGILSYKSTDKICFGNLIIWLFR